MFQSTFRSLVLALTAGLAHAQLELPDKPVAPKDKSGGVEIKADAKGDVKKQFVPEKNDGVDTSKANGGLELPDSGAPAQPAAPVVAPPVELAPAPAVPNSAAGFVLGEVAKLEELDDELLERAIESLSRMGPDGRDAALIALAKDHAPSVALGARVLLATGRAEDGEAVQRRLRQRVPAALGGALVDLLVELDPVRASPQFLLELLGHPQSAVRNAAQRHLDTRESLPFESLAAMCAAKSSDARARAVQLASRSADPRVLELLLERSADSAPSVARHAIAALAVREEAGLDEELTRRAFAGRWILRAEAYALLAVIEREDRGPRAILGPAHAAKLLENMSARDPFVAGVCAAALAGVGFRSPNTAETAWLDLDVPHRLVRVVAAEDFSPDYASLADVAARRLALISDHGLVEKGAQIVAWWSGVAGNFRARRASLTARVEDSAALRVVLLSNEPFESFTLLGPALAEASGSAGELAGDVTFLTDTQARALFELLAGSGAFGAERLPGLRGSSSAPGTLMTIALPAGEKTFRFAGVRSEPWFEGAVEAVRAVRERNRWQRCVDGEVHANQLALWRAEAAWWEAPREPHERDRRLAELTLAKLARAVPAARDAGLRELAELQTKSAVLTPSDFSALSALAAREAFVSQRLREIVELALSAGRDVQSGRVPVELGEQLVRSLLAAFAGEAAEIAAHVISESEAGMARQLARDPEPLVRAVAVSALARGREAEDVDIALELLRDPDPRVEGAAVLALGEQKVAAAATEIAIRARTAQPSVRAKALVAVGRLGGEHALSVLLAGLAQREQPEIYAAAVRGLVELRDPQTVPLFVAVLSQGSGDVAYPDARRGLIAIGAPAWSDLLRIARSTDHKSRREAALVLAEQCVPESVSPLLTLLTERRDDARIADELCVLTCVDFRGEADPALSWWTWWEGVVHDDSLAWFCAALERAGASPPRPEELAAGGRAAREFVFDVLQRDEAHLVERARRELARLIGFEPGPVPASVADRAAWVAGLRRAADARGQ